MTISAVHLTIPGKPTCLKRPRFACRNGKYWAYNSQQKEMDAVRRLMKNQYQAAPIDEAVTVFYRFDMPMSSGFKRRTREGVAKNKIHPGVRPDISNLIKYYEDCMNDLIYLDDSLIIRTEAIKVYSEEPKTSIWIRSATENEVFGFMENKYGLQITAA